MRSVLLWALWGLLFLPNLFVVVLAYPVAPFVAAYGVWKGPKLPWWLVLWSTLDNPLGGIPDIPGFEDGRKGWALWWQYVRWVWRNPSNGWQTLVYGFKVKHEVVTIKATPVFLGWTWKVWMGWNDRSQEGTYRHYLFQIKPTGKAP